MIEFPVTELRHLSSRLSGRKLKFTANVTESLTGITLSGSSTVEVFNKAFQLEFPKSNPDTFKPGLEYVGYVSLRW